MKKYLISILLVLSTFLYGELIGAKGALSDNNLTQNKMLIYALQDEYLAKNEYEKTIQKFGNVKPFSSIKKSEDQHIAWLLPLFEKYKVEPVNETKIKEQVKVASSLKEATEICAEAEVKNIAMYNKFLADKNLPDDIKAVFEKLKRASENHLMAFKKQLE